MEEEKKETETTEETSAPQPQAEKETTEQAPAETEDKPTESDNDGEKQIEQAVADVANNKDLLEVNKKLDTILNLLSENHASTADEKEIVEDEKDDETSKAEAEAFEKLID